MFWKRKKYDFYAAGPMRGYADFNKAMFDKVAKALRDKGFTVWSPSEHNSHSMSFSELMKIDLNKVINDCDGIALLPGWRKSLGASVEAFTAFACGKNVVEIQLVVDKLELAYIDLSGYSLPYLDGETSPFDPHKCDLNSFGE